MNRLRHPVLHWALGILLGGVFVYASLDKIEKPAEFARIVYHYQILGPDQRLGPLLPNLLAVTLPWAEATAGAFLIVGVWRREAALVTALLLLVFLFAVGWALAHGVDVANCGCFSVSGEGRRAGLSLLVEDGLLLVVALFLAAVAPRRATAAPAGAH